MFFDPGLRVLASGRCAKVGFGTPMFASKRGLAQLKDDLAQPWSCHNGFWHSSYWDKPA